MTIWSSFFYQRVSLSLSSEERKAALINDISCLLDEYRQKVSYSRYKQAKFDSVDHVVYEAIKKKLEACFACLQYFQRNDDPNFLKTIILLDEQSDKNFIYSGISSRCQAIVKRTLRFIGEEDKLSLGLNAINPDCDELQDKQTSPIPHAREIQQAVRCGHNDGHMHIAKYKPPKDDVPVGEYKSSLLS